MKIFIDDSDIEEKLISDVIQSFDRSTIHLKGELSGKRGEDKSDLTKELIAHDAIALGPSEAARIHGITQPSASKYHDGKDIADDETRTRVLATRHNIADTAIAKLMDTLNMFDPSDIEKPLDKIKSASMLAGIVEKVSIKDAKNDGNNVHLHIYASKQRKVSEYQVIDV